VGSAVVCEGNLTAARKRGKFWIKFESLSDNASGHREVPLEGAEVEGIMLRKEVLLHQAGAGFFKPSNGGSAQRRDNGIVGDLNNVHG
jgi:hypothetical protein